jgi:hypothetical protein
MVGVLAGIGAFLTAFWQVRPANTLSATDREIQYVNALSATDGEISRVALISVVVLTAWAAAHIAFGVATLMASARTRELRGYGWTLGVAILTALPIHVSWFVGLPVAICLLVVLQRAATRQAFAEQARRDREAIRNAHSEFAHASMRPPKPDDPAELKASAKRRLMLPAIGLLLAAVINLVTPVAYLWALATPPPPVVSIAPVLVFGIMLLCGTAILFGAFQMRRLRWYSSAMLASIVALIPCGPAWPLSLPFGILALVALNRNEVRQAFALAD